MNRACWVVLLAALVLTAAAQAATERVTPLVVDPRGSVRGSSYVHVQDGTTVETARGGLPIVEWEGKRAVKLHATHSPIVELSQHEPGDSCPGVGSGTAIGGSS